MNTYDAEAILDRLLRAQRRLSCANVNANLCQTRSDHREAGAAEDAYHEAYALAVRSIVAGRVLDDERKELDGGLSAEELRG